MNQEYILAKIVDGETELIDAYLSKYDRYNSECKILITPQHVKNVLIDFLNNKIDPKQMQRWADFLCFNDALCAPNNDDEDYYEGMWHVIQKLSTPFIDGEINIDSVSEYLSEINNFKI